MKACFIINPVSGRRSTRAGRRSRIEQILRRLGIAADLFETSAKGHALELTRQAVESGFTRVISVGGDGTMNEVATGLVGTGRALGLVPLGSGNGLARDLGLPLDFDRAVEVAMTGANRTIDSGRVNGRYFFNVMGIGFDAELGRRFNESGQRGFLTYCRLGLKAYFQYERQCYRVEGAEGPPVQFRAFLLSVANSTQYGNGARIAPRARLDDGRLDLVAVVTASPLRGIELTTRLFTGTVDRSSKTVNRVGKSFNIRREVAGPVHTDGEIHEMGLELKVEVCPSSVEVVVET